MKKNLLLVLAFAGLSIAPAIVFSQVLPRPNLGNAATYALFTSAGAFNVTGAAVVTGDVGTQVGAFNAFPPGTVTGTINVANAASLQAANDVCAVYADLSTRICGNVIGVTMGNGQILLPGVYCTGAASTINGLLTLDGGGDPNAIFIIQVNGTLATNALSDVQVTNSASLDNVFWQVNGAFTLADNSTFRGTVITSAGAITLLGSSSLLGRGLACNGAINVQANIVTRPNSPVMPVTLLDFSATRQAASVLLKWSTASEQGSRNFTVEHTSNASSNLWESIAIVPAAGTSNDVTSYSVVDNNVIKGNNYYRLRSTDLDGNYTLSSIKLVYFDKIDAKLVNVFPNPFHNNLVVSGAKQGSIIMLMDISGKVVKEQKAGGSERDKLELPSLLSGIYLLKVISKEGKITTIKVNRQ